MFTVIPTKAPNLLIAPAQYQSNYHEQMNNALRLYFSRVDTINQQLARVLRSDYPAVMVDFVDFNTNTTPPFSLGRMNWNQTDKTLDVDLDYDVTLQLGQEQYARVGNTTGSTIPNGTVVGFAGSTSEALLVAPYLADGTSPSLYILGVMTHDLPDSGDKGYCTTWGFVRDLDTSAFSAGDILYASPSVAGGLTNVKPRLLITSSLLRLVWCLTPQTGLYLFARRSNRCSITGRSRRQLLRHLPLATRHMP